MSLHSDIRSLGGLAATHELLARGHGRTVLRLAIRRGDVLRIRKGWYALPDVPQALQRAARVGGRLTCVSAARELGLWIPNGPNRLHVAVSGNSCQLRAPEDHRKRLSDTGADDVLIHWNDDGSGGSRYQVSVVAALEQLCVCQAAEFAFVVCESALFRGAISSRDWAELLPRLRPRVMRWVGSLSESGTESMFAFRMRRLGVRFRQQVRIGRYRVDFLIGERLVVEIDSLAFHDPTADHVRDAHLGIRGYRVLRFPYRMIVEDWATVRDAVLAAMSRGDHLA
ncbi:MAG TPA: DUF559 domain-containing protein [Lacisediminihabitans sp.]|uniref:DUF559 domain-containing protein n=1 Tax=Lacisediminihabitans sp. TaxID=2787631 RepID=UPI002ED93F42